MIKKYILYTKATYEQSKRRAFQSRVVALALILSLAVISVPVFVVRSHQTNAKSANKPVALDNSADTSKSGNSLSVVSLPPPISKAKVPEPTPPVITAFPTPNWTKLPLYVDPQNDAAVYSANNSLLPDISLIKREGDTPTALWFGDWNTNVQDSVDSYVSAASGANAIPVVVVYNIPNRDCGNYSAGGAQSAASYTAWVQSVAAGIAGRQAVVILEPDALASVDCLTAADQQSRFSMLSQAVGILKANSAATIYIDAGNPAWQTAGVMADRLRAAGIAQADGFSLNVSNHISTPQNQQYGDQLSKLVGYKHYIIDTSRNGNGAISATDWCNASSGALGSAPTTNTGSFLNDALLWVKLPWESDGSCNGAPPAGQAYWSFAIQLAKNAGW